MVNRLVSWLGWTDWPNKRSVSITAKEAIAVIQGADRLDTRGKRVAVCCLESKLRPDYGVPQKGGG